MRRSRVGLVGSACGPSEAPEGTAAEPRRRVSARGGGAPRATRNVGRFGLTALVGIVAAAVASAQQPPAQPRFQATVEVTSLDVSVVDGDGKPIQNLTPADFVVRIDGNQRRIVSAEWIPLVPADAKNAAAAAPPDGFSSNEASTGGRLIVIAVDQPNIRFGGTMGIARAANAFIDRLGPADRVAIAGLGFGAPAAVFTGDHARLKQVISRMMGQKRANSPGLTTHNIALVEALEIDRGDRGTLAAIQDRECPSGPGIAAFQAEACRMEVEVEARQVAQESRQEADQTIQGLRDLFIGLRGIDAPKTLILISEGFILTDDALVADLGRLAADARTSVYAMRLDNQLFDAADGRMPVNPFADRQARGEGLELLAGASRGTLFTVAASEAPIFARIEAELSGYYLVGVESDPRDHDGKPHPIRVDVPRRGAYVRSRRQVLNAPADTQPPRTRREAAMRALRSPLLSSALPLRVASFSLQGPERGKVQMLLHADIGTDYSSSKAAAVAYVITDASGRVVDSQATDQRLPPVMIGVPSALQFSAGASLAPGDYTLRLAAADGDRVGSVEHQFHAALSESNGVTLSEFVVGGPIDTGDLLQPSVGYTASFGSVQGYFEAYGPKADAVTVKYEVAADPKGAALVGADAPGRLSGDDRMIFSKALNVNALPPGKYVLRANVAAAGKPVTTLSRAFEVAAPKVLMTSADGLGNMSVDAELYLPVEDGALNPPFHAEEAAAADTVRRFSERVSESSKATFTQALALYAAGDYPRAEAAFKKLIDPDADSTPGLAYLAATYAAGGHDTEASSAWRTALIDGDTMPQLYAWLGGALMRSHDYAEARSTLEEALGKWPGDVRFTKPLAMIYATFGRGREAVRTLERYLLARSDDVDALYLGIEWLFHVHSAGAMVHNRAEDLKLAHSYADAYRKSGGAQAALVKQWLDYLEAEKR